MAAVKTVIHVHTDYSFDSNASPESLADAIRRERVDCIAVTDHDTIDGALHLRSLTDARVIIGEEVTTRDGDLIGLFLRRAIAPGMSARQTAVAIREQGGLVLVPHPFISVFGCGLQDAVWDIVDLIDAVEVCNAQSVSFWADREAGTLAEALGLARFVGSDSHLDGSMAPCYQWLPEFDGAADFLEALHEARFVSKRHPLWYFAASAYKTVHYLTHGTMPRGYGIHHTPPAPATPPGAPALDTVARARASW